MTEDEQVVQEETEEAHGVTEEEKQISNNETLRVPGIILTVIVLIGMSLGLVLCLQVAASSPIVGVPCAVVLAICMMKVLKWFLQALRSR